jgi:hypothetical protein
LAHSCPDVCDRTSQLAKADTALQAHPLVKRLNLAAVSRLRPPLGYRAIVSAHRRLKWRRARRGQRAKAQGASAGRTRRAGGASGPAGAGSSGRAGPLAGSSLATDWLMLAILASLADRGFLPRYRGRDGNRPWASRGGNRPRNFGHFGAENRPRSAAETGPGLLFLGRARAISRARRATSWRASLATT